MKKTAAAVAVAFALGAAAGTQVPAEKPKKPAVSTSRDAGFGGRDPNCRPTHVGPPEECR